MRTRREAATSRRCVGARVAAERRARSRRASAAGARRARRRAGAPPRRGGWIQRSPCCSSGSVRKNGERMPIGWHAEQHVVAEAGQRQLARARAAADLVGAPRAPAPTRRPAPRATAAASPFGPEPTTTASTSSLTRRTPTAGACAARATASSPCSMQARLRVDDAVAERRPRASGCDSTKMQRSSPASKSHCAWIAREQLLVVQVAVAEVPARARGRRRSRRRPTRSPRGGRPPCGTRSGSARPCRCIRRNAHHLADEADRRSRRS